MKKWFILLYLILAVALSGCHTQTSSSANTETEVPTSQVAQEDCMLCGANRPFDLVERPNDTVMILCLNTWDLGDTKMYEYGDQGEDANYSGASVLRFVNHDDGECNWAFDSNTGYHTCEISILYGDESALDLSALPEQLCSDCLANLYDNVINRGNGTAYQCDVLYDTATGHIHPISSSGSPYHIGDFWVYVEHQEEHDADIVYLVQNDDTTK